MLISPVHQYIIYNLIRAYRKAAFKYHPDKGGDQAEVLIQIIHSY